MAGTAILLDTHALLWWATNDRSLSRKVKRLVAEESSRVIVSAASAWEIATKVRLGKLTWTGRESIESYCRGQCFEFLPVTCAHGERAGSWPASHVDPFDRLLAAQSAIESVPLATNDPKIDAFGIDILW
ncbi:MAG: type II toxin-antitoxin system VapC family toxin [Deltaproteobacteria bacterium]|nr:type II toxin-antitoxin system VapC family toxin [Deltaproteobacteria bacterium]